MSWQTLFHTFSRRSTGRLNAVCNTARSVHKPSDRKLRFAIYVQATQVSRYVGRDETRESAVFQVDTIPAIAGYCRTEKGYRGAAEECHAITQIATDRTTAELHGAQAHPEANRVI